MRHVAVVTGASRGIGRAVAHRIAGSGRVVVCAGRQVDALEATAAGVREAGGEAVVMTCDVTVPDEVDAVARHAATLGIVDVVVNNAGAHATGRVLDMGPDVYRHLFDVSVIGAVNVTRALAPAMVERCAGRIVNVASTAGRAGSPFQAPYNAAKHALVGFTRCAALELAASGVTVNAVCPGWVETELFDRLVADQSRLRSMSASETTATLVAKVPLGRFVQVDEVAAAVEYLCSSGAGSITGQCLTVDGGALTA